ncbi:hypothetical protein Tco_0032541 [Tanacetum coccineum]
MFSLVLYVALMLLTDLDSVVDEDHGEKFFESERKRESLLPKETSKRKEHFRPLIAYSTGMADVVIPISSVLEVKPHGVPAFAFIADGLSVIATRRGTLMMLDSCIVTACTQSSSRTDHARALIYLRADRALKDTLVISVPRLDGNGVMMHIIKNKVGTSHDWFQTRTKTAKGASTSVSNVFEVPGDLEDDGHLDVLNAQDPKRNSRGTHMEENLVEKARKNMEAIKKKTTSTLASNTFSTLREDNRNFMEDLVDDTRKKVGAPPRKTV